MSYIRGFQLDKQPNRPFQESDDKDTASDPGDGCQENVLDYVKW